jgi:YHS domain-containing protein
MRLLDRIVRILFWLLVVSWSAWFLRRLFGSLLQNATPEQRGDASNSAQTPGTARRLVRDPVCGMRVDETLAIPLREDGVLLHFCSPACRDASARTAKKFAANG